MLSTDSISIIMPAFNAEKTITRAEAAMILYKLAGGENR